MKTLGTCLSRRRRRSRDFVGALSLAALAACGSDFRTNPSPSRTISIESGDRQLGSATAPLHHSLVVRVRDEPDDPVGGVQVRWSTTDGGEFSPSESNTDEHGFAHTLWTLGATTGRQYARASVDEAVIADFAADASNAEAPTSVPVALTLATPEGSGQTVHPDYVTMPGDWPAFHSYLLITPY